MKNWCLVLAISGMILTSCSSDETHNPIEGTWVLNQLIIGGQIVPLDACTSESEIVATIAGDDYGRLIRYTYYWENDTCQLRESNEKWNQSFGEYKLDDGNIVDQNERIWLTNDNELIYSYEAWEFTEDTSGQTEILRSLTQYTYSRK